MLLLLLLVLLASNHVLPSHHSNVASMMGLFLFYIWSFLISEKFVQQLREILFEANLVFSCLFVCGWETKSDYAGVTVLDLACLLVLTNFYINDNTCKRI